MMATSAERFFRSWWWLVLSMVVPALLVSAGGLYLAHEIAWRQAEIVRLNAELRACKEHLTP